MNQIINYLKRHKIYDTTIINRLFVSAFIKYNNLNVQKSSFLMDYCITNSTDYYFPYLSWLFNRIKKKWIHFELEDLINLFEFVISPSNRVVTGAIFTPFNIRQKIVKQCLCDVSPSRLAVCRIADISCGCGGFLMDAAVFIHNITGLSYSIIFRQSIFGIDIEEYSIERTKIILSLLALINGEDENFEFNLLCENTLNFNCEIVNERYKHFDFVLGNPPYVCSRNMTEEMRKKVKEYDVSKYGHPDLYIPFIQIAIECLSENGRMGYITMNSFFNSLNGRGVREYFNALRYKVSIIDFRDYPVFKHKSTYTCLLFVNKEHSNTLYYADLADGNIQRNFDYEKINYSDLNSKKGWSLKSNSKMAFFENCGMPLGQYCNSRHGIATLNNRTYIFRPVDENEKYYTLQKDNANYLIEKKICRDIVNSNKLNSIIDFSSIIEKVIYPYTINENGKAVIYNENEMNRLFPYALFYLKSQRSKLDKRDKINTKNYPTWYAFGRTQSLIMPRYKLFFPKIADKQLKCVLSNNADLLLYNGIAFVSDDYTKLKIVKCFLESSIFWNYVSTNGKPYSSGFYSLNGVNIKKFCIPYMDDDTIRKLLEINDKLQMNDYIMNLYNNL